MYKKRTLYVVAAFLLIEAALIAFLPSRLPAFGRFFAAVINAAAAAAVLLLSRQAKK